MDERLVEVAKALYGLDDGDDDPWNPLPKWGDLSDECQYQMLRRAKWGCEAVARIVRENPTADPIRLIEKLSKTLNHSPGG